MPEPPAISMKHLRAIIAAHSQMGMTILVEMIDRRLSALLVRWRQREKTGPHGAVWGACADELEAALRAALHDAREKSVERIEQAVSEIGDNPALLRLVRTTPKD